MNELEEAEEDHAVDRLMTRLFMILFRCNQKACDRAGFLIGRGIKDGYFSAWGEMIGRKRLFAISICD